MIRNGLTVASNSIAIAIEPVDIIADDSDRALDIGWSIAAAASAVERSPIVGPPGFRARFVLMPISVDLAGHGVMGVAAPGSVLRGGEVAQG